MKPAKIFDVMNLAVRARDKGHIYNPLFVSAPGLGKTEITQQWAKGKGMKSIVMTLSSYDPPDFKGFPITQVVNGRQRLSFATPDFWPDDGEGVIILEELNRSPTSIMQCILSLTDARRGFDGYVLPKGWIVVGCINPEGVEYDVNAMDPALKDRFEIYQVTYDKENFLSYMKSSEWHKDLVNFVESGCWNYLLPEEVKNVPGAKYVAPRTMSKVNAVIQSGFELDDEMLHYSTALGANVAKDFFNFRHNESPVFYNDLVTRLEPSLMKLKRFSEPSNFKNGMVSLTIKDIVDNGMISDELLVEVVKAISVDQGAGLIREIEFKRKDNNILTRICKTYPEVRTQFKATLNYGKKNSEEVSK